MIRVEGIDRPHDLFLTSVAPSRFQPYSVGLSACHVGLRVSRKPGERIGRVLIEVFLPGIGDVADVRMCVLVAGFGLAQRADLLTR